MKFGFVFALALCVFAIQTVMAAPAPDPYATGSVKQQAINDIAIPIAKSVLEEVVNTSWGRQALCDISEWGKNAVNDVATWGSKAIMDIKKWGRKAKDDWTNFFG